MLTPNQTFLIVHIAVSVVFLHAFAGGLATLVRVREGVLARRIQVASVVGMAVMAWATVISGTWLIYPGYRAAPPAGAALEAYPRAWLISSEATAWWHTFAMEWKEHVGWLAPFLATAVAVVVLLHGDAVRRDPRFAVAAHPRRAVHDRIPRDGGCRGAGGGDQQGRAERLLAECGRPRAASTGRATVTLTAERGRVAR